MQKSIIFKRVTTAHALRIFMVQPIELRSSSLRKVGVQPCVTLTLSLAQGWRGQLRKAEGVGYARLQLFHN